jgi:hypothetical protein
LFGIVNKISESPVTLLAPSHIYLQGVVFYFICLPAEAGTPRWKSGV